MLFRAVYLINGLLLLVAGFYISGHHDLPGFGIEAPGGWQHNRELWRSVSFIGSFGAALMAFGLASMAVSTSEDSGFHRKACGFFLVGHFWLSFVILAKQSFWGTPGITHGSTASWLLFDLVAFPAAPLLFCLIADRSDASYGSRREWEDRIREVAGQEERNRLGQDLHDSVKQQIYSIHTTLAAAQARWQTDPAGARTAVDHSRDTARDAMVEMNALLDRLRRDPIESVGLVEAVRRQCEAVGFQTGAAIKTHFGALPAADRHEPGKMSAVFRIAQEALANVARHARPRRIELELGLDKASDTLMLRVQDDGRGFDTSEPSMGMGLGNMRARAEEIGAHLELQSDNTGTVVSLRLPLIAPNAAQKHHHRRRLVAAVVSLVPVALIAWIFPGTRSPATPLMLLGGVIATIHTGYLIRLQSRKVTP